MRSSAISFRSTGRLAAGNTPLVRINSLSDALGVEILGKAEVRSSEHSRMPIWVVEMV